MHVRNRKLPGHIHTVRHAPTASGHVPVTLSIQDAERHRRTGKSQPAMAALSLHPLRTRRPPQATILVAAAARSHGHPAGICQRGTCGFASNACRVRTTHAHCMGAMEIVWWYGAE
eukprot:819775-Rhodomonas_salina.2